ncbi:hypothetical protein [Arthrobacter woluwensis]|uniref:hypothetical protein n=1 Tax=Arthrobacter woluwensis TaxID=156980 RepID=UPI00380C1059
MMRLLDPLARVSAASGSTSSKELVGFDGLFACIGAVVEGLSDFDDEGAGAGAEDDVEGRVGDGVDVVGAVVVGDNEELLEEELVEDPSDVVGCLAVDAGADLGDVERDADDVVGVGEIGDERVDPAGDAGDSLLRLACSVRSMSMGMASL